MSGPSSRSGSGADDGWGSSTTVYGGGSSSRSGRAQPRSASPRDALKQVGRESRGGRQPQGDRSDQRDEWQPAGPPARDQHRQQRDNRSTGRAGDRSAQRRARAAYEYESVRAAIARAPERGRPAWQALIVMLVLSILGGLIDTVADIDNGFNIGIVVASVVAILIVKRSHMFPIVIAPPIVYTLGAIFQYLLRSGGKNATSAKLDAAANYLVYGFPAIAAASAAVLIIAGARMILRK